MSTCYFVVWEWLLQKRPWTQNQNLSVGTLPQHRKRWMLSVPSEHTAAGGYVMAAASRVKLCRITNTIRINKQQEGEYSELLLAGLTSKVRM